MCATSVVIGTLYHLETMAVRRSACSYTDRPTCVALHSPVPASQMSIVHLLFHSGEEGGAGLYRERVKIQKVFNCATQPCRILKKGENAEVTIKEISTVHRASRHTFATQVTRARHPRPTTWKALWSVCQSDARRTMAFFETSKPHV